MVAVVTVTAESLLGQTVNLIEINLLKVSANAGGSRTALLSL